MSVDTLAPLAIPSEPTSQPKLSEILRLGSMTTQQTFNVLYNGADDSYCALGTIYHMAGWDARNELGDFNNLVGTRVWCCPDWLYAALIQPTKDCTRHDDMHYAGEYQTTALGLVVHLNDHHKMPRNEIAQELEARGL